MKNCEFITTNHNLSIDSINKRINEIIYELNILGAFSEEDDTDDYINDLYSDSADFTNPEEISNYFESVRDNLASSITKLDILDRICDLTIELGDLTIKKLKHHKESLS